MFDLHQKLNDFYHSEVKLSGAEKQKIDAYKNFIAECAARGIDALNAENNSNLPYPQLAEQGSMATQTMLYRTDFNYNLDFALIFENEYTSKTPAEARQFALEVLLKGGIERYGTTEIKSQIIDLKHTDGCNFLISVHRKKDTFWGEIVEYAGEEWIERNPHAIAKWYNETVNNSTPYNLFGDVSVEADQLLKITCLIKRFSTSRASWNLPSGMILSLLAAECFKSDPHRDDIALFKTITSMSDRLKYNKSVLNPADHFEDFTQNSKTMQEVKKLHEKLEKSLEKLAVLYYSKCTEEQALIAWKWFFN